MKKNMAIVLVLFTLFFARRWFGGNERRPWEMKTTMEMRDADEDTATTRRLHQQKCYVPKRLLRGTGAGVQS